MLYFKKVLELPENPQESTFYLLLKQETGEVVPYFYTAENGWLKIKIEDQDVLEPAANLYLTRAGK